MLLADTAQAVVVTQVYEPSFETIDQSTYATGPTQAHSNTFFLGIDTGPNPFRVGGIEDVTIPGWWIFPSSHLGSYGVVMDGNFDLRTGFEVTTREDSGTIDASQLFRNTLTYEDQLFAGSFTNFATTQQSQSQSLQTTFPNVALDIDLVLELDAQMDVTGCIVDCLDFSVIPHVQIDESLPVFDYNRDVDGDGLPDGGLEFFGLSIPELDEEFASASNNPSLTVPIASPLKFGKIKDPSIGYITIEVPQAHTAGTEASGDSTLNTAAEDDFLEIGLDVDSILSLAITKGLRSDIFGSAITIPGVDIGVGWEFFNFAINWDMDYSQEFELMSNLVTRLDFSESVLMGEEIFGIATEQHHWVSSWQGLWSSLPDFTSLRAGTIEVTPTFDLWATLRNLTELDYDLDFLIELFKFWFDAGIAGNGEVHLFEAEPSIDLFRSTLFDDTFELEGWNSVTGAPFQVHFSEAPPVQTLTCQRIRETHRHYASLLVLPTWGWGFFEPNAQWKSMLGELQAAANDCTAPAVPSLADLCPVLLGKLDDALGYFPPGDLLSGRERLTDTLSIARNECSALTPPPETLVITFDPPEPTPPPGDQEIIIITGITPGSSSVPVPGPGTLLLLALGVAGLGAARMLGRSSRHTR